MAIAKLSWFFPEQKKPVCKLIRNSKSSSLFKVTTYGKRFLKDVYGFDCQYVKIVHEIETLNKNGEKYL